MTRAGSSKERGQPRFANPTRFTLEFSDAANLGRVGRRTKTTRSWNATNASHNAMSGKARSTSEDDTALAREMLGCTAGEPTATHNGALSAINAAPKPGIGDAQDDLGGRFGRIEPPPVRLPP
jgi:hypothetical protein